MGGIPTNIHGQVVLPEAETAEFCSYDKDTKLSYKIT
jgi:hypothetical protein